MPRWRPGGAERLAAAAFALFDEQGFERTTVAEITRRAGLTQRTFYHHFADKREVLFALAAGFQDDVVRGIAEGADLDRPLDAVVDALRSAAETWFEEHRAAVVHRQQIVGANPELRERELTKRAALTEAIAAALMARGLDPGPAFLTAGAGGLVLQAAIARWTKPEEDRPLRALLSDALHALRATVDGPQPWT